MKRKKTFFVFPFTYKKKERVLKRIQDFFFFLLLPGEDHCFWAVEILKWMVVCSLVLIFTYILYKLKFLLGILKYMEIYFDV